MRLSKILRCVAVACLGVFAFGANATETDATGKPKILSGTVEIHSTQIAFIISGKAGGGVLEFEGEQYFFNIAGLGVGGVGVQKIDAVGAVYNLNSISEFPGAFVQARAGATLGDGKGWLSLSNGNGVIMDLKFTGKGVALSIGADGMIVSMK